MEESRQDSCRTIWLHIPHVIRVQILPGSAGRASASTLNRFSEVQTHITAHLWYCSFSHNHLTTLARQSSQTEVLSPMRPISKSYCVICLSLIPHISEAYDYAAISDVQLYDQTFFSRKKAPEHLQQFCCPSHCWGFFSVMSDRKSVLISLTMTVVPLYIFFLSSSKVQLK